MSLTTDPSEPTPRPEHPRPQLVRADWRNLNGAWEFEADPSDDGLACGLLDRPLAESITVPFCPESVASGIGRTEAVAAVWYRRIVELPEQWVGRRALLHFGAVDHDATVWANGVELARHRGGFTPFTVDLSPVASPGERVEIVVRAQDPIGGGQARGKQTTLPHNHGCFYTRTTGIWQTVWLEAVAPHHIRRLMVTPSLSSGELVMRVELSANTPGSTVSATLTRDAGLGVAGTANDTVVVRATARADLELAPQVTLAIPEQEVHAWSPDDPHLYGLTVAIRDRDGVVVDEVTSYAGLRSIALSGKEIRLNGEPIFQRLVLDQGYYPDTIMTAPSDAALVQDIELARSCGFTGARLHQKVFEERFLYHADRLGYLVWGEFGDWGSNLGSFDEPDQRPDAAFVGQWVEVLRRDYNHPSIIGWCPLNETNELRSDRITALDTVTRAMFDATKAIDGTRPVIDASGWAHRVAQTDVYDGHCYEQRPWRFAIMVSGLAQDEPWTDVPGKHWSLPYAGQPYLLSEYGGIWWNAQAAAAAAAGSDQEHSWGYGDRVRDLDEFYSRLAGLTDPLIDDPLLAGFCYTQLTDVFQEQNGLFGFDRSTKFDVQRLRSIVGRPRPVR